MKPCPHIALCSRMEETHNKPASNICSMSVGAKYYEEKETESGWVGLPRMME